LIVTIFLLLMGKKTTARRDFYYARLLERSGFMEMSCQTVILHKLLLMIFFEGKWSFVAH
jgi:hypothetical protein